MAVKKPLEVVQPLPTEETAPSIEAISDRLNDEIASQILDNIDWQKVTKAIIRKAPAKLFAWLTSGNNTPINISAFPELAALPSSADEGKAA
jgi:hypothetical protein